MIKTSGHWWDLDKEIMFQQHKKLKQFCDDKKKTLIIEINQYMYNIHIHWQEIIQNTQ